MADKIVVVVPSIRPESMKTFLEAWRPLFVKHGVRLVTVWDGDEPEIEVQNFPETKHRRFLMRDVAAIADNMSLFCRKTDAVRNAGFVIAAQLKATVVVTLDDDVTPRSVPSNLVGGGALLNDPIADHLKALSLSTNLDWFNTADAFPSGETIQLRGVPYRARGAHPVMLSHGVWHGIPDFDGETQLQLESEGRRFYALPYHVGPVPRGCLFPMCGMNLAVKAQALGRLYFAPMGADSGVPELHRVADIFCGVYLKAREDLQAYLRDANPD